MGRRWTYRKAGHLVSSIPISVLTVSGLVHGVVER
jgi:hypothetical protein